MRKLVFLVLTLAGMFFAGCVTQKEFDACTAETEHFKNALTEARAEQLEQVKLLAEAGQELQQNEQKLKKQLASKQKAFAERQQQLQNAKIKLAETEKSLKENKSLLQQAGKQLGETLEQLNQANQEIERLQAANQELTAQVNESKTEASAADAIE